MSIGKRISEAVDRMMASDAEGALIPASIALDATASREYPAEKNNMAYKAFINANLATITKVAFHGPSIIGQLRVKYDHPDVKPASDGLCTFSQIMYHVVRCGLLHAAALPTDLRFSDRNTIQVQAGSLVLPASLIYGMLVAVVVSPVNSGESLADSYTLTYRNQMLQLNQLFAKPARLQQLFDDGDATPAPVT